MKSDSARYQFFNQHPEQSDIQADIIAGLSASEPYILPKYFYDEIGSRLFEKICQTKEYYPTRTEVGIIRDNIDRKSYRLCISREHVMRCCKRSSFLRRGVAEGHRFF